MWNLHMHTLSSPKSIYYVQYNLLLYQLSMHPVFNKCTLFFIKYTLSSSNTPLSSSSTPPSSSSASPSPSFCVALTLLHCSCCVTETHNGSDGERNSVQFYMSASIVLGHCATAATWVIASRNTVFFRCWLWWFKRWWEKCHIHYVCVCMFVFACLCAYIYVCM